VQAVRPSTPTMSSLSHEDTANSKSPSHDRSSEEAIPGSGLRDDVPAEEVGACSDMRTMSKEMERLSENRDSATGLPLQDSQEWLIGSVSRVSLLRTLLRPRGEAM
jgi:hypothetical protein